MSTPEENAYGCYLQRFYTPITNYAEMVDRQPLLVAAAHELFGDLTSCARRDADLEYKAGNEPDDFQRICVASSTGEIVFEGHESRDGQSYKVISALATWIELFGEYAVVRNEYETDERLSMTRISSSLLALPTIIDQDLCAKPDLRQTTMHYELRRSTADDDLDLVQILHRPHDFLQKQDLTALLPNDAPSVPYNPYLLLSNRLCAPLNQMATYGDRDGIG
jgi:hypothetical protein